MVNEVLKILNCDEISKQIYFLQCLFHSVLLIFFQNIETDIGAQKRFSSSQPISLFEKNNNILTEYEDFCIKNGSLTCYPFKDFDFIGKNVVCYKCYQKFASRSSYQVHIGTNICVKPIIIRNPVYMKFKRKYQRKKTSELLSDIRVFQTRQKSYTNVMQFTVGDEKKQRNYYYSYRAPKKRLQKKNNNGGEPRKRGRPRKIKVVTEKVQFPKV